MTQASDSNEKNKKEGKKMKSRIGLKQYDNHLISGDVSNEEGSGGASLNNSQSHKYLEYMESRNDTDYEMKSKYGRDYMKK